MLPSAAAAIGVPGFANSLLIEPAQRIVVVLVDGLGARLLQAHVTDAPRLSALSARELTSGFPSTTPSGLGSLGTGSVPGEHGFIGASFVLPETGRVLHPLSWGGDPNPEMVQPERTVFERVRAAGVQVRAVSPAAYAHSGLTRAVLRGADYRGADSLDERVAEVCDAASAANSLTYAYWGELDKTGHISGVDSQAWLDELRRVDAFLERVLESVGSDCRVVVTADHGMVDVLPDDRIDIDAIPSLWDGVETLAGEPRARHIYARHGAADDVRSAWQERLGDSAWVLSRTQAAPLLGAHDEAIMDRVGDVVAVARGNVALVSDRTDSLVSSLIGQHGGLSAAESRIPLLSN